MTRRAFASLPLALACAAALSALAACAPASKGEGRFEYTTRFPYGCEDAHSVCEKSRLR